LVKPHDFIEFDFVDLRFCGTNFLVAILWKQEKILYLKRDLDAANLRSALGHGRRKQAPSKAFNISI